MKRLAILGSTGSIGTSTLDVVSRHPERFEVFALAACRSHEEMLAQCMKHRPRFAVLADLEAAQTLRTAVKREGLRTEVLGGAEALEQVASHPDVTTVMAAIVGAAGLPATLAAARAGKDVLLANKEALVMSGELFMDAVAKGGGALLPIDSEHSAVFQSLPRGFVCGRAGEVDRAGVRRILLTASGGPFRTRPLAALADVTPDEACAHPNWSMGRKISVDSATMMNKGLEVIEAHYLFGASPESIEVVVHPQSVIHSLVEYVDGSVLAQLSHPDMRTPIAHALAYPARIDAGVPTLDLARLAALSFEPPDFQRFACLRLAYDALREGGTAPAALNAANETAVAAFLAGRIAFTDIAAACEAAMSRTPTRALVTLDDAREADAQARSHAEAWLAARPVRGTVPA